MMCCIMANGLTYARKTASTEATKQLAETLAPYLHPGDVVVLSGDLGAGKTQFVQGVAAGLGISAQVTSPTFNILLEYHRGRASRCTTSTCIVWTTRTSWRTRAITTPSTPMARRSSSGARSSPARCRTATWRSASWWRRTAAAACSRMRWETAPVSCSPCGQTTRRPACRRPRPAPAASSCRVGAPMSTGSIPPIKVAEAKPADSPAETM